MRFGPASRRQAAVPTADARTVELLNARSKRVPRFSQILRLDSEEPLCSSRY